VPWKFVEKLFFYQGLISGLILFRKNVQFFYTNMFLDKQIAPQRFLATIANLPNNAWVQNNYLDFFGTIANLATNQDATLRVKLRPREPQIDCIAMV